MILDDETVQAVLAQIGDGVGVDGREDEGPAGELFRELRYQRKTIFREEQRASMGEDVTDSDAWDWETLGDQARTYLVDHAKDLEPMAMLVEASVRLDGTGGLARGMTVLADLIEQYWETGLFPMEDEEDGVEARFQPLSGLSGGGSDKDGTLILPLRRMALARDGGDDLCYFDKVSADALMAASQTGAEDQRAERTQEAQAAYAASEGMARRIGRAPLQRAQTDVQTAETAWRKTIGFISERTKPRFPAASRVSDELRAIADWLDALMRLLPEEAGAPADTGDVTADGGAAVAGATPVPGGPMVIGKISQRDDALRAVVAAAEYFERYEPLSPIGATLREVDRRARLSLHELLAELIPDSSVRETFYWRSGIKPPEGSGY